MIALVARMGTLICKVCVKKDGVASAAVVEHLCTNPTTGKQFKTYVCKQCLEAGRETRVTCQTFMAVSASVTTADSVNRIQQVGE